MPKRLMDFIGRCETGYSDDRAYDTIIGHNEDKLPKPLTQHTVAEVMALQAKLPKMYPKLNSSAVGKYQFIRKTLAGLIAELNVPLSAKFDATLQDRLGYQLLLRRGIDQYLAGQIPSTEFALNCAKEWASLPVLAPAQGRYKKLKRGDGYYDGDGVNGATTKAETFEKVLKELVFKPVREEKPAAPQKAQANWWLLLIIGLGILGLIIALRIIWGL